MKSEWLFGDNSPPELVPTLVDSVITVRHTYGISGTYFATLRIYNDIECSEEITIPISLVKVIILWFQMYLHQTKIL